ncbi:MAG: hypothetical protein FWB74_00530 [Defluviitaleaceae bacterium]|nr:hypothetical protein [Defluviitaleaceae bacterium]
MIGGINSEIKLFDTSRTFKIAPEVQAKLDQIIADQLELSPEATAGGNRLIPTVSVSIEHEGGSSRRAFISPKGIWIIERCPENKRNKFIHIEDDEANIPQSKMRTLEHIANMVQNIPGAPPGEGFDASPKARLQYVVNAFDNLRSNFCYSDQHLEFSKAAFREIISNFNFMLSPFIFEGMPTKARISPEWLERRHAEEAARLEHFGDVFLDNFERYGAQKAFETAWETALA